MDIASGKKKRQSKEGLSEILLESGRVVVAKDQPSTPMIKKSDLLNKTIRSHEDGLDHLYEQ